MDLKEVTRLIKRIYDRTGSSARIRELEDIDKPMGYHGASSALDGDPNNIGGVVKCPNCAKDACSAFLDAMSDEERFSVFTHKRANWKNIENHVRDFCFARWEQWATARPYWFNPQTVAFVPDNFIPPKFLDMLGGENRDRKVPAGGLGSRFTTDTRNGDMICTDCGFVARENLMHEGEQFRKFEGKEDRNHHGGAKNQFLSESFNMGTSLSQVNFGQMGGPSNRPGSASWGAGGGTETVLRNTHSYIEMNTDSFGKKERATRLGYKDKQKREAQNKLTHVADTLKLHKGIILKSMELFSEFRDDREQVQSFKGILAACMIEAFNITSREGQKQLMVTAGDIEMNDEMLRENTLSKSAVRKRELHTTKVAESNVFTNNNELITGGTKKVKTEGGEVEGMTS